MDVSDLVSTCRVPRDYSPLPESDDDDPNLASPPGAADFRATVYEPWGYDTVDWRRASAFSHEPDDDAVVIMMGIPARVSAPSCASPTAQERDQSAQPARPGGRQPHPRISTKARVRRECTNIVRLFRTVEGALAIPHDSTSVSTTQQIGESVSKRATRLVRMCAAQSSPRCSVEKFLKALLRATGNLDLPRHVHEKIVARLQLPARASGGTSER